MVRAPTLQSSAIDQSAARQHVQPQPEPQHGVVRVCKELALHAELQQRRITRSLLSPGIYRLLTARTKRASLSAHGGSWRDRNSDRRAAVRRTPSLVTSSLSAAASGVTRP